MGSGASKEEKIMAYNQKQLQGFSRKELNRIAKELELKPSALTKNETVIKMILEAQKSPKKDDSTESETPASTPADEKDSQEDAKEEQKEVAKAPAKPAEKTKKAEKTAKSDSVESQYQVIGGGILCDDHEYKKGDFIQEKHLSYVPRFVELNVVKRIK